VTPPSRKQLLRLATAIHAAISTQRQHLDYVDLPDQTWERAKQLTRQLRHAQVRGWNAAYRRRQQELQTHLERLRYELADRERKLVPPATITASLRDLLLDLSALHQEFDEVEWDFSAGTLCVTTDPITLNDQYLGSFAIELEWRRLQAACPYRVIARDPHPATRDSSVTHPHVQDAVLCEGEGKPAIRAALASGRLYDFFSLVSSILTTYNPSSAYVGLDEWSGTTCTDCGGSYGREDYYSCCGCEDPVCDDCGITCCVCGDPHCAECTDRCTVCDDSACKSCLETCTTCSEPVCRNCLADDNQTCESCHERRNETSEEPESVEAA
jgi:hypothetical protein